MIHCQKCGAKLHSDFGMVHCGQCGEINFVDDELNPAPDETSGKKEKSVGYEQQTSKSELSPPEISAKISGEQVTPGVNESRTLVESPLQGVEQFGNRVEAVGSALCYVIKISGIDSRELREEVVDHLSDPKLFGANSTKLEAEIKDGRVELRKVSSIIAAMIVKKLRHLDIEVSWNQENIYENSP